MALVMRRLAVALLSLTLASSVAPNVSVAQSGLPRTVTVNTLGFYQSFDGEYRGVMAPVKITIDENTTGRMRLGFFEDEIDGYGDMWQASAWVSNVVAIDLSGAKPGEIQIQSARRCFGGPGDLDCEHDLGR